MRIRESTKLTGFMLWLAIAGLVVWAVIATFRDRLLYFPAKAAVGDMVSGGLRAWPGPHDFRGLVAEPVGVVRGESSSLQGVR